MNDLELRQLVSDALSDDPRVDHADIAVAASDGVIALRGTVRSLYEKWQAIENAKCVAGVRGIVDELTLDLPAEHQRTDSDIARAIAMRLESSALVPDTVSFVVKDGTVTLSGSAIWAYQRDEAMREVRAVLGVRNAIDDVLIETSSAPGEGDVRDRIRCYFERSGDRAAGGIAVTVQGNAVVLRGCVKTWLDRERAAQAVWSFRGVTRLDNRIEVVP